MGYLDMIQSEGKSAARPGTRRTPSSQAAPSPQPEVSDPLPKESVTVSEEVHDLIFADGAYTDHSELDQFWGKYKKLAGTPKQGSVLYLFKQPKVGKKEMTLFMTDVYLKRLMPCILDPEVDLETYFLYSLVVPHAQAVDFGEMVHEQAQKLGVSRWNIISQMTGQSMTDRGDSINLMRQVLRRYPKIMDFLVPKRVKYAEK